MSQPAYFSSKEVSRRAFTGNWCKSNDDIIAKGPGSQGECCSEQLGKGQMQHPHTSPGPLLTLYDIYLVH